MRKNGSNIFLVTLAILFVSYGCGGGSGSSSSANNPTGAGEASGGGTNGSDTSGGGSSEGSGGISTASSYPAAAEECVRRINQYRATISLPPYQRWAEGEACADDEAKKDAEANRPHGSFGSCGERAQNTCPGWPGTPETMIDSCLGLMWAEGPGSDFSTHGHYLNMSSTSYTRVACGFYVTPLGSIWTVQDFR